MTVMGAVSGGGSASVPADERCKAWVVFDGFEATLTPLDSYNVDSITDNGTGQYAINFTTALPSANYTPVVWAGSDVARNATTGRLASKIGTTPDPTASVFSFDVLSSFSGRQDADHVSVAIFGG